MPFETVNKGDLVEVASHHMIVIDHVEHNDVWLVIGKTEHDIVANGSHAHYQGQFLIVDKDMVLIDDVQYLELKARRADGQEIKLRCHGIYAVNEDIEVVNANQGIETSIDEETLLDMTDAALAVLREKGIHLSDQHGEQLSEVISDFLSEECALSTR